MTPDSAVKSSGRGEVALRWWVGLTDEERGDSAALARLRRSGSTTEAAREPAALRLVRKLGISPGDASWSAVETALDLARVLANVRSRDDRHPMRAAGYSRFPSDSPPPEPPRLSEARFRRLLQVGRGEEKVTAFTRLIALLDSKVNIGRLATDYLDWNHPVRGDRTRERWAFEYYAAGSAAPTPTRDEEEDRS